VVAQMRTMLQGEGELKGGAMRENMQREERSHEGGHGQEREQRHLPNSSRRIPIGKEKGGGPRVKEGVLQKTRA